MKPFARALCTLAIAGGILIAVTRNTCAQDEATAGRESLRGLPGIILHVQDVDPQLEEYLLTPDLRTHVEMKLRAAGVRILTEAENDALAEKVGKLRARHAGISFGTKLLKASNEYFIHVNMSLIQMAWVSDKTDMVSVIATTWSAGRYGAFQPHHLQRGDLMKVVDAIVDEFINAWLATHPEAVASQKQPGEK